YDNTLGHYLLVVTLHTFEPLIIVDLLGLIPCAINEHNSVIWTGVLISYIPAHWVLSVVISVFITLHGGSFISSLASVSWMVLSSLCRGAHCFISCSNVRDSLQGNTKSV
ncbi:unnamed protein product, partial [Owenia fusiformis]